MNELNPCPFCGGKARVYAWTTPEDIQYYAACTRCSLKTDDFRYEADLIAYWNAHLSIWQRVNRIVRKLLAWMKQNSACTSKQLSPCPFCGSTNVGDDGLWRHVIRCYNCGARSKPFSKWNEAVEGWNFRSLSSAQTHADELLEALDYVLTQLRLAVMGFSSINIDANKLQALYNTVTGEYEDDDGID